MLPWLRIWISTRLRKTLAILALVWLAWGAWLVWPPQPEVRIEGPISDSDSSSGPWRDVSPDGRTYLIRYCERVTPEGTWDRLELHDLLSGQHLSTISESKANGLWAPNGSAIAHQDASDQWHLIAIRPFAELATIPTGPNTEGTWTSDGHHFIVTGNDRIVVHSIKQNKVIIRIDVTCPEYALIPDGSGLIALSTDRTKINMWKFEPPHIVDSLNLPFPPADPDQYHTTDGPQPGSMRVERLATSRDGSTVAALIEHYQQVTGGLTIKCSIEAWNRQTGQRSSIDAGSNPSPLSNGSIDLDPLGKLVSTSRWHQLGNAEFPKWVMSDGGDEPLEGYWDLSTPTPRRINSPKSQFVGFQIHYPGNRRMILPDDAGVSLFDLDTMAKIARFDGAFNPVATGVGEWFAVQQEATFPSWIPEPIATFAKNIFGSEQVSLRLYRTIDGSKGRTIPNRHFHQFTSDGKVWTKHVEVGSRGQAVFECLERWSPEAPRPWWLWLLTAGAGLLIVRTWRRRPNPAGSRQR